MQKMIFLLGVLWGVGLPAVLAQDPIFTPSIEYKGFGLGMPKDSIDFKRLERRGKYQQLMRYDLVEKELEEFGIQLKSVRLFFFGSRLHSIEARALNDQGRLLRTWTEAMYGEGRKEDALGYRYAWDGKYYKIWMEQNLVTKDVKLEIRDERVHRKYYKFMYQRRYPG